MRCLLLSLLLFLCVVASAAAQPRSVADLANYRGADREEILKAGAKKEGKLVWYTSLTAHREIANIFEAKYPGIKVETYRAGPNDLTSRLLSEAQARRNIADLVETTPATLMMMRDSKLLMPYFSPHLANFPDESREEADKSGVYWTTDRESIVGLGYNRNLIRAAEVPKSFAELVKPENKAKIGVSGDTTGVRFIGAIIKAKGEEFIKQLRPLDMKMHMISGGAVHELMAAGEMPMSNFDFSQPCACRPAQRCAHGMGAVGLESDERGWRCAAGRQQQRACGVVVRGFLTESRRTKDFR